MTHYDPDTHLSYDELLQAMTDRTDLGPGPRAHLDACRHCRRQAENLTDRFDRLGQMARQMAPKPQRVFRVPARHAAIGRWRFNPAMALGALGVLIFVFTLWGPQFTGDSDAPVPMVAQHLDDDRLMAEIDELVEDALPAKYREVAVLSDDQSVEELDDFINWMVPSPDEDEFEDTDQPDVSDRDTQTEPIARSFLSVLAEEGIV